MALNLTTCNRLLALGLFCLAAGIQAGIAQESTSTQFAFDRANDQLQEGNYYEALSTYRLLEDQGQVSGALFLNMGISYVQIDSLGQAKYYFMKARQFEETGDRAAEALEFVESQFSRQSAVLPQLPWDRAVDWLRVNLGVSTLLGISLLLLNLGVVGVVITWFYVHTYNNILRKTGLVLAALGLILVFLSFYVQYVELRYSEAVMVQERSNVLERPTADSPIVNQAYEGYEFTVDHTQSESHPGWNYVRMSNGLYGWISSDDIRII